MIDTLYDKFKSWSAKGSVYIISDTHFDDHDCKLMDVNWIEPQEHIDIIKKTVHKCDTLIHLGDVGNPKWLEQIKAYKVLIMGNHDQGATNFIKQKKYIDLDNYSDDEIITLIKKGEIDEVIYDVRPPFVKGYKTTGVFDEVYSGALFISEKILLSHEPIISKEGMWFNIHGHDHNNTLKDFANKDGFVELWNELNLASNVANYKPYNLGAGIKNGLLSLTDGIHRVTIDKARNK